MSQTGLCKGIIRGLIHKPLCFNWTTILYLSEVASTVVLCVCTCKSNPSKIDECFLYVGCKCPPWVCLPMRVVYVFLDYLHITQETFSDTPLPPAPTLPLWRNKPSGLDFVPVTCIYFLMESSHFLTAPSAHTELLGYLVRLQDGYSWLHVKASTDAWCGVLCSRMWLDRLIEIQT